MNIWDGKTKAFTMSYDDGVESDRKLLDIINYYGLKCTFNLNSGILGTDDSWQCGSLTVKRLPIKGLKELYKGHEIAVHGRKHLVPAGLTDKQMEDEFLLDLRNLHEIFGEIPVGMAYAYGAYDDRTVEYLKSIGLRYARTVEDSCGFDLQDDLMRFKPTCHHNNPRIFDLIDEFLEAPSDKPQLFYLWGHSYEFDAEDSWKRLERICERVSGYDNIFYGTGREVLLNKGCK